MEQMLLYILKYEQTKTCECGKKFITKAANKTRCDACQKAVNEEKKHEAGSCRKNEVLYQYFTNLIKDAKIEELDMLVLQQKKHMAEAKRAFHAGEITIEEYDDKIQDYRTILKEIGRRKGKKWLERETDTEFWKVEVFYTDSGSKIIKTGGEYYNR